MPSAVHNVILNASNATATTSQSGVPPWSSSNLPWSYGQLQDDWPSSALALVVSYTDNRWYSASKTFVQILDDACSTVGDCIIQLPAGTFHISNFNYFRTSANAQAMGYFNANLRGLLGSGVLSTFIQVDPNSIDSTLISWQEALTTSNTCNTVAFRLGNNDSRDFYMAGITWLGTDQPNLNHSAIQAQPSNAPYTQDLPACWGGLVLHGVGPGSLFQNLRFIGFGHALTNSPPFETGAIGSQSDNYTLRRVEIDGQIASTFDSSRPRRSGMLMLNSELNVTLEDGYLHHSERSGYTNYGHTTAARANGSITTTNWQVEHNADYDDGLGGSLGMPPFNHEEVLGPITHNAPIFGTYDRENWQVSHGYVGCSTVGTVNGLTINDPVIIGSYAQDNGCFSLRVPPTYYDGNTNVWYTSSGSMPITVTKNGVPLTMVRVGSGTPYGTSYTASQLQSAGITPDTHWLVKVS